MYKYVKMYKYLYTRMYVCICMFIDMYVHIRVHAIHVWICTPTQTHAPALAAAVVKADAVDSLAAAVAVCCSVLQCVAVCCSAVQCVLQCVAPSLASREPLLPTLWLVALSLALSLVAGSLQRARNSARDSATRLRHCN